MREIISWQSNLCPYFQASTGVLSYWAVIGDLVLLAKHLKCLWIFFCNFILINPFFNIYNWLSHSLGKNEGKDTLSTEGLTPCDFNIFKLTYQGESRYVPQNYKNCIHWTYWCLF
jgi:hypothetical protein